MRNSYIGDFIKEHKMGLQIWTVDNGRTRTTELRDANIYDEQRNRLKAAVSN